MHKVNCKKIYDTEWCNDDRMKPARSWCNWIWAWTKPECVLYGKTGGTCQYQEEYERPAPPPAPPPPRKDK